ncbi:MAG: biotin-independent malonate decarboxylase subunit gamma [Candidatus Eremiobacteraeota bacterium]|nr:biotin-independent malonate decarboxylase subunit gamma [Candidatus Eremiobacteraeota bacterium]
MKDAQPRVTRGRVWFDKLAAAESTLLATPSVLSASGTIGVESAHFLAVVPNEHNRFPRAREGEVGIDEGWALAREVKSVVDRDHLPAKRAIVAIVDVPSQAYGRREELLGLHLACAAAVDAYATARLAGHPVIGLIVGQAYSGAFLAHGYQASRLLAFDDPGVVIHAMGKTAAARVTKRTVEELEALAETVLPLAYDVRSFAQLGLLYRLLRIGNADAPSEADVAYVRRELGEAIADARRKPRDLSDRLSSPQAKSRRAATIRVREALERQW